MTEQTLSEKEDIVDMTYDREDVKDFIKKLIEISEENDWEVATDDNNGDGFIVVSGKEYITWLAGDKLI
jgi:hypothetical protein